MGSDTGRAAVLGDALAAAAGDLAAAKAAAEGEQVELFDIPTRFVGVRGAPAATIARADALPALERAAAQHRRGRPPGSANRSTKEWREYLLKRGVHPLEQMMRMAMHSEESLAIELGCTPLEAARLLFDYRKALAPYFAAPMVPVDDAGQAVPFFQMVFGGLGGVAAGSGGDIPPWERRERLGDGMGTQSVQNQQVIDAVPDVSHGDVSHGDAK